MGLRGPFIVRLCARVAPDREGATPLLFYKSVPFDITELKADGEQWLVTGFASTFGNLDHTGDVVMRGAFDETLASGRARKFLWQHDIREPIGVEQSLKVAEKGLLGTWKISQTTRGRDAYQLLKDGAVDSLSIGYVPTDAEYDDAGVRLLKSVDLLEVSLVSIPANDLAVVTQVKAFLDSLETRATWDTAFVNNLPDSAFAVILPGGSKDSEGKTTPRSLRKLPHHGSDGSVDLPHLRNALARLPQTSMPDDLMAKAKRHLNAHAKAEGVGNMGKADDHEHDFKLLDLLDADVPFDELLGQLGGLLTKGADEAEALHARRLADERELSTVHLDAIKAFGANAEAMAQRLASLLPAPEPKAPSAGIDIRFELARRRLTRARAVEHAS